MTDTERMAPLVLLDNNFLATIIRKGNEDHLARWWDYLGNQDLCKPGEAIEPVVTTFSILELAGAKQQQAPAIAVPSTNDRTDFVSLLHKNAIDYFFALPDFSIERIRFNLAETARRTSEHGKTLFESIVAKNLDGNFHNDICENLAIDYLFQYQYPFEPRKIHMMIWPVIRETLSKRNNLSYFRLVKRMWEQLTPEMLEKLYGRERAKTMVGAMKLEPKADFLDTQAIHFGVIGKFHHGQSHKVHIFTMDKVNVVSIRSQVYRDVLKMIHERFLEENLAGLPMELWAPGVFHVYDGKDFETVDVKTLP